MKDIDKMLELLELKCEVCGTVMIRTVKTEHKTGKIVNFRCPICTADIKELER